jgi:N-methylhydantoinase A/oxoprolinase/acetone carboxylase beta subunit
MTFHVCVDVGGTFTDLFALEMPSGAVVTFKAPTTADGVGGVIDALDGAGIAAADVATLVFGSTRATNAVAEGRLAPVAFVATEGFSDTLEIRRLWREHLFGWQWERPRALVPGDLRFGVRGRIDREGRAIEPLDEAAVTAFAETLRRRGIESVAVSLLFSFLDPGHERRVKALLTAAQPGLRVFLSSDVNPEIRDYERGSTTVVAAALSPIVDAMLGTLEQRLAAHGVPAVPQVIKSNGGIMSASSARAKPLEILRSGPAGGVASLARFAEATGRPNLIGIDIGGTTADVSVITDGAVAYTQQAYLAWDIPVRVAMADVRSVGAGGGSIAWIDPAGRLHVGPRSAGALPGPACYGRGGSEPTVTDAAVVARHIDPARFLGGRMALDIGAARRSIETRIAGPLGLGLDEAASGILHLVTARMAQLIGEMTVQVGLDPRDYALVGFGGAGPLFVAALAEEVEAAEAIVPTHPAVWSAVGGLFADGLHDYARTVVGAASSLPVARLDEAGRQLAALARDDLEREARLVPEATFAYALDLRYAGQSHELTVPLAGAPPWDRAALAAAEAAFEDLHERTYAHRRPEDAREVTTLRLRVCVPRGLAVPRPGATPPGAARAETRRTASFHGHGHAVMATVHDRSALRANQTIAGPAFVEEDQSVTVVPPGFTLTATGAGYLRIARTTP